MDINNCISMMCQGLQFESRHSLMLPTIIKQDLIILKRTGAYAKRNKGKCTGNQQ